jgi:uncharacterized protein (TIGR02452 family)
VLARQGSWDGRQRGFTFILHETFDAAFQSLSRYARSWGVAGSHRSARPPRLRRGAWGCGAFGNDLQRTASDFRQALEGEFSGVFSDIVFAVTDWSVERRFLGPFRDVFAEGSAP